MSSFWLEFIQQVFNGLSLGAVYALIAIGYTMVYGIIGMINFAHGDIYMIGAYTGLVTLAIVGTQSSLPLFFVVALMLVVAVVVTGIYGYVIEQVAYKPVRKGSRLVALITAIGASIFLENWMAAGQGAKDRAMPQIMPGAFHFAQSDAFEIFVPYTRVLVIVVTVLMMIALTLYIKYSRMGKASRACSQDIQMASLLGIDIDRVISFTFILGAVLAAVAGVLIGLVVGKINPFIGFIAGIKAFTAAVLGGIGSIPGAMLGGVVLGLVETFAAAYISSDYKDIVAFLILVLVLLVRPTGLLGRPEVEKV